MSWPYPTAPILAPWSAAQTEDLKLASSKMTGAERRAFQAAMALKYGEGSARQAERGLGWNRDPVELGLHERRPGVICLGAQAAYGGSRAGEEQPPDVAAALWARADSPGQQAPTFRTSLSDTRRPAAAAWEQLRAHGFPEERRPAPSTLAAVLNRNGYRLRKVGKAKPPTNSRNPPPSSPTWRTRTGSR